MPLQNNTIRLPASSDPSLTAAEKVVCEAILDVVDDGPSKGECWDLYASSYEEVDQDDANMQRLDFARAVVVRVRELKQVETNNHYVQSLKQS